MSALGTSSQARKNAKEAAKAARDKEKDGPESTIAKKRAQLQSSLAKIEIFNIGLQSDTKTKRTVLAGTQIRTPSG